jgi:nitrogen fixation protein FixH
MTRELTGRHVLMIFVGAFGIIIAVNLTLAFKAVSTFPGLEVKNSYIASQGFDRNRAAQLALGWEMETALEDGVLTLRFTDAAGQPVQVEGLRSLFGQNTSTAADQVPAFVQTAPGVFAAPVTASRGGWMLRVEATAADGTPFLKRVSIPVR